MHSETITLFGFQIGIPRLFYYLIGTYCF